MKDMDIFVCVPVYNEERIIGRCLDSILRQKEEGFRIKEVVVISSGSTDKTNDVVDKFCKKDSRVRLVVEDRRRGKVSAINLFLDKILDGSICVLVSGDVVLEGDMCLRHLVVPFRDDFVGMTGARACPVDRLDSLMGKVTFLLWELRHRVSFYEPKTGEMVAFRKVFKEIPKDVLVDEAYIEWEIKKRNLSIVYCPDAVVKNKGPETFSDFIKQRKRIYIGHKLLEKLGYKGSTFNLGLVLKEALEILKQDPVYLWPMFVLFSCEFLARVLGRIDLLLGRYSKDGTWEMIETTKEIRQVD